MPQRQSHPEQLFPTAREILDCCGSYRAALSPNPLSERFASQVSLLLAATGLQVDPAERQPALSRDLPQAELPVWARQSAEFRKKRASQIYQVPSRCILRIFRRFKSRLSPLMRKMK